MNRRKQALYHVIIIIGCALIAFSCGNKKNPPGGPPDTTAPQITEIVPTDRETGVPLDFEPVIFFSENIEHISADKIARLFPATPLKPQWDGQALRLIPKTSLHLNTIYDFYLKGEIRDRDGNRQKIERYHLFTTGDSLPDNILSGRISHLSDDYTAALIELIAVSDSQQTTASVPKVLRVIRPDLLGNFVIPHIVEGAYHLRAYIDKNADWQWQKTAEPCGQIAAPIQMASTRKQALPQALLMKLPGDAGAISGQVTRPDSLQNKRILLTAIACRAKTDTLHFEIYKDGSYLWNGLPAGSYRLHAKIAAKDATIIRQLQYPDTVRVEEGIRVTGIKFNF